MKFPNIEGNLTEQQIQQYLCSNHILYQKIQPGITSQHVFTHQKWIMVSYHIILKEKWKKGEWIYLPLSVIQKDYAIPTAFQPFLNDLIQQENIKF